MRKIFVVLFLIFVVSAGIGFAFSSSQETTSTADEILRKVDEIRAPGDTFIFNVKITFKESGGGASQQYLNVSVKDADKSLVQFISPASVKGRFLLMNGNNMWIYIPGTGQPIRISPQQRLLGQVSNGDVARISYSLDYAAKFIKNTANSSQVKLELNSKNENVTYSKIILWVEKQTFKPVKAQFYAASGKLLKTALYKGYSKVLGRERPLIFEIRDELHKGEYSLMEYSDMEVVDTPAEYFQKSYLKYIIR